MYTNALLLTNIGFQKRVIYLLENMRDCLQTQQGPSNKRAGGKRSSSDPMQPCSSIAELTQFETSLEDQAYETSLVSLMYRRMSVYWSSFVRYCKVKKGLTHKKSFFVFCLFFAQYDTLKTTGGSSLKSCVNRVMFR